jgi:hypothetical protein
MRRWPSQIKVSRAVMRQVMSAGEAILSNNILESGALSTNESLLAVAKRIALLAAPILLMNAAG